MVLIQIGSVPSQTQCSLKFSTPTRKQLTARYKSLARVRHITKDLHLCLSGLFPDAHVGDILEVYQQSVYGLSYFYLEDIRVRASLNVRAQRPVISFMLYTTSG